MAHTPYGAYAIWRMRHMAHTPYGVCAIYFPLSNRARRATQLSPVREKYNCSKSEGKKFEAYLILNYAIKRLVKMNQENLIENYDVGFMNLGLSFNFDGVSPLKSDDILNLEKLIKE